jgi:hypothetical protein
MPGLDELDLALRAIERSENSIDSVAGITKNLAHAPCMQSGNKKVTSV